MCGIAGLWNTKLSHFPSDVSRSILKSLYRRGPESSCSTVVKTPRNTFTYLWHTRLAIQDCNKRSNQPYEDDLFALVYNGEIYNHKSFNDINYPRKIYSDTDFLWNILHNNLYFRNVNNIEGMWAFAQVNKISGDLHLSKDRFGQKPLYYAYLKNSPSIAFSSSINTLLLLIDFKPKLNFDKLRNYLFLGFRSINIDPETTFLEDIYSVQPGCSLIINNLLQKKTVSLFDNKRKDNKMFSYSESIDFLKSNFKKSVEDIIISDRPLALLLSGGIDSSYLYKTIKELYPEKQLSTYSYMNTIEGYDEEKNINTNLNYDYSHHTFIRNNELDIYDLWLDLTKENMFPLPNQSAFSYANLVKEISNNNDIVILSGVGADEIFGGYYTHLISYVTDLFMKNKIDIRLTQWHDSGMYKTIRMKLLKDYRLYSEYTKSNIYGFHEYNLEDSLLKNDNFSIKNRILEKISSVTSDLLYYDLTKMTLPPALYVNDLVSMYYSCESRAPYLCNRLVDFAIQLPNEYLFNNFYTKSILRDAASSIVSTRITKDFNKIGFYGDLNLQIRKIKDQLINLVFNSSFLSENIDLTEFTKVANKDKLDNVQSKSLFCIFQTAILEECYNQIK